MNLLYHAPVGAPEGAPGHDRRPSLRAAVALACVATLAGSCASDSDDDDGNPFVVRSTQLAAASANVPLVADGDWLATLVSEAGQGAGGTDFNGDGDTNDAIAVRIDTDNNQNRVLDVAATDLAFARRTLFLTVSEAQDGTDWNGDTDTSDTVLLYQTPSASTATYLDDLAASSTVVAIGGSVIYSSADAPAGEFETNLRLTTVAANGAAPAAPTMVLTGTDPNMDGISYAVTGADGDIVFLSANEAVDGDLNGDGDSGDGAIFAALDLGATIPAAVSTGLGYGASTVPTAVEISGDWLVAFLVDEAQEGVSLNDPMDFSPTWAAANCATPDTDTTDFVLHWFLFSDLSMNTGAVNTGLIGTSTGIAYAHSEGYVGVVSPEGDQGSGTCDYNGDADSADDVFRWVEAMNPASAPLPETATTRLVTVDQTVPGGTGGVARLDGLWVVQTDEATDGRDYDTEVGVDRKVVIALDPAAGNPNWNALHSQTGTVPATATWMSEDPESSTQLLLAMAEETRTVVPGLGDLNGDSDVTDSVPTLPRVLSGNTLTFPGISLACRETNAGIVVEQGVGYARIDEADQNMTDLNGDGDMNDVLLVRFSLSNAFPPTLMGTSNNANRPVVSFGSGQAEFGASLTEESMLGQDLNADGDTNDTVIRYFELP